jgi:hypothetical protein
MYVTYHASIKKNIAYELQKAHDKFWKYDNDTYDFSQIETTIWRIPYYYELLYYRDFFLVSKIRALIKHKTKVKIRNHNSIYDDEFNIVAVPFSCLSICKPKFHVVSSKDYKLFIFKKYTFPFTIIKNVDKVYGYRLVFTFFLKRNYYEE